MTRYAFIEYDLDQFDEWICVGLMQLESYLRKHAAFQRWLDWRYLGEV